MEGSIGEINRDGNELGRNNSVDLGLLVVPIDNEGAELG